MKKEIKLNRGWTLTKFCDGHYMVNDTKLNVFIHADTIAINNGECDKTWLKLRIGDKYMVSFWLTTKAAIKRAKDLLEA